MYLTFEEYTNFGGNLSEQSFNRYEFKAESIINWYTFDRLNKETSYSENVKRLMFELIDLEVISSQIYPTSNSTSTSKEVSSAISSQSNDGFSTSYNVLSASELKDSIKDKQSELVHRYLSQEVNSLGRKLLYRGLYPNE